MIFFILIIVGYKKNILPIAVQISREYAVTEINSEIDKALYSLIEQMGLENESFFEKTVNSTGEISYMEMDSVLINQFCSRLGVEVSKGLNQMQSRKIYLPISLFAGIDLFDQFGPRLAFYISPMGNASVDYYSEVVSAGINRVNYNLWLNVKARVGLVNPLDTRQVEIERKVLLVSTVFSGEVPKAYLGSGE